MQEVNLCNELTKYMSDLNYSESQIALVTNHPRFIQAVDKPSPVQRSILTTLFYNILISTNSVVPSEVRYALNCGTDLVSWLDDYKTTILPFIKQNETHFFPTIH